MDIQLLKNTILFRQMTDEEIEEAIRALQTETRTYPKGAQILRAGDETDAVALVLSGSVTIESNDVWGNRTILSVVEKGQFFAETYAFLPHEPLLVDVIANEASRILFLNIGSVRAVSDRAGSWAIKLLLNLLTISSHKNLHLSGRSFHTAPKSIRGRIMSYLYSVSLQNHSLEFDIPFDRQQLADYLNVERSALSKELGKMQKEGILTTKKSHFILLEEMDI